jgi:hypothetical protein
MVLERRLHLVIAVPGVYLRQLQLVQAADLLGCQDHHRARTTGLLTVEERGRVELFVRRFVRIADP